MGKVIVSKEVFALLERVSHNNEGNYAYQIKAILDYVSDYKADGFSRTPSQGYLDSLNVTVSDLEKALRNGYELAYEFKKGDIIFSKHTGNIITVGSNNYKDKNGVTMKCDSLYSINQKPHNYVLICKSENNELNK